MAGVIVAMGVFVGSVTCGVAHGKRLAQWGNHALGRELIGTPNDRLPESAVDQKAAVTRGSPIRGR